jgi:hypothetical protein
MLDECKGEKFEEVLARFAMVVLRAKMKKDGVRDEGAAETEGDRLVAEISAYRVSLQKMFQRRVELRTKAEKYSQQLDAVQERIERSKNELTLQSSLCDESESSPSSEDLENIRAEVDRALAATPQWSKFIFEGSFDPVEVEMGNLTMPAWPFGTGNTVTMHTSSSNDDVNAPMTTLAKLVSRYEDRAKQLQQIQEEVDARINHEKRDHADAHTSTVKSLSTTDQGSNKLRFGRHHELVLRI